VTAVGEASQRLPASPRRQHSASEGVLADRISANIISFMHSAPISRFNSSGFADDAAAADDDDDNDGVRGRMSPPAARIDAVPLAFNPFLDAVPPAADSSSAEKFNPFLPPKE
jgi:hypothetical protein